jgi:dTDP-4-dehydrorhamnose reductase
VVSAVMNKQNMRILLLGAAGQVGSDCDKLFRQAGYLVTAITRKEIDFSDIDSCDNKLEGVLNSTSHHVVVNAMAYTAVDKAEVEPELADAINHISVQVLAQCCVRHDIPLIHISTDYVFDGKADEPYTETSKVNPLGVYGKTKWLGEQAIALCSPKHVILRTSWVFGLHGSNFVKTILRLASDRDELTIVSDQRGCPTYAADIASVILRIIQKYNVEGSVDWGTYHCVGEGELSWYEFAQVIVAQAYENKYLKACPRVTPIPTVAYPTPAARPAYSVLNTNKLNVLLGEKMPSWGIGLSTFF